jgi:hypothetical protein
MLKSTVYSLSIALMRLPTKERRLGVHTLVVIIGCLVDVPIVTVAMLSDDARDFETLSLFGEKELTFLPGSSPDSSSNIFYECY